MLKNYVLSTWRGLLRDKVTSFVNIAGLCVGMTSAVLALLWVHTELNFDDYHEQSENIFRLTSNMSDKSYTWENTSYPIATAIKEEMPEIKEVTRCLVYSPVINLDGALSYPMKCAYVDDNWFDFFHYDLLDGNFTAFKSEPNTVVLAASDAIKYFGTINSVGSLIRIDSGVFQVAAVVADPPVNSSLQFRTLISIKSWLSKAERKDDIEQWGNDGYLTFIKTIPNADPLIVESKINKVVKQNLKSILISLVGLQAIHFETELRTSKFEHGDKSSVYIFGIVALLLLLVACINYVNLTTARASLYAKEVSIRKVVGANRRNLFVQYVVNSLVVSFLSMMGTVVLVQVCSPLMDLLTGKQFTIAFSSPVMWQVIGATLLASFFLNSIYPAVQLSSFDPLKVFKGRAMLNVKDAYFRKGLVIIQFVISVSLIASTLIIYNQMKFIQQRNPGYNRSQVLLIPFPPELNEDSEDRRVAFLKTELLKTASVERVSLSNRSIVNITRQIHNGVDWEGRDPAYNPTMAQLSADADLASTMQLKMKDGRWFDENKTGDRDNFILNETAVEQFKILPPVIGQRLTLRKKTGQIVGVVKDFNSRSLHEKIEPLIVVNNPEMYAYFLVRIAAINNQSALAGIEQTWKRVFPESPFQFSFLDDDFNRLYEKDGRTSSMVFIFSTIAILISALGLFALSAFVVEQRTKEMGVRKILGASFIHVMYILTKEFALLILIAVGLAFPMAWWGMGKWLSDFAYHIDVDLWTLSMAGLASILVASLTVSWHSIKSANTNPVKSLRSE